MSQAAKVTLEQIYLAGRRIKGHVRVTPFQPSARLKDLIGADVYMKMENMQHTGAYKERGALNKLLSLTPDERAKGVVAASAGNHAQGLAYHAGRLGVKSTIFMPVGTPVIKVTRTKFYGANVELTGHSYDDAFEACLAESKATGQVLVHPFDDPMVIAGQGTIALEILDQPPDLDYLLVPVGGGGLISGISKVFKALSPQTKIIGVEPAKIPSMAKAVGGDTSVHPAVTTIAEGINVRKVGTTTLDLCKSLVHEWITVTDEEICRAILFLLEGEKTVTEGAGAAVIASLIAKKIPDVKGKKIGSVLSGGNIDVTVLSQVIECGLEDSGRRIRITMDIPDRPGTLSLLVSTISNLKANVINVTHERHRMASFGVARVLTTLDVRDAAHGQEILQALNDQYKDCPHSIVITDILH